MPKYIALDTETTGPDFKHGCLPFMVSMCIGDFDLKNWEWLVDPYSRSPYIKDCDLKSIQKFLDCENTYWLMHNALFDVAALQSIGLTPPPWDRIEDTMLASHVLSSSGPHGLKERALQYLKIDDHDELELKEVVKTCRHNIKYHKSKPWNLAHHKHPQFPTASSTTPWWKLDMWLPETYLKAQVEDDEPLPRISGIGTVTKKYCNHDVIRTTGLWNVYSEALEQEGLMQQYRDKKALLPVIHKMQSRGITGSFLRSRELSKKLSSSQVKTEKVCKGIAKIDNLNSPKQLQAVLFDQFKLTPVIETKTGYSTNEKTLLTLLDQKIPKNPRRFLDNLLKHRKAVKAIDYQKSYELGAVPLDCRDIHPNASLKAFDEHMGSMKWFTLYTNFNPTGTCTCRFSSSSPNAQQISKNKDYNLRSLFGPAPKREWYSVDYSNIEMRIFAYASGDKNLIQAFDAGESVHLIFAEVLYPSEYKKCKKDGVAFNDRYKATYYQWIKNGNFALIYGATESTADQTYRVSGAYKTIRKSLPLIDKFIHNCYRTGKRDGFVTTLGGYRLDVPLNEPHKAANYFVQGTAGWVIQQAMVSVHEYLHTLDDYHIIMQVHDELNYDFPRHPRNKTVMKKVVKLMEAPGDTIGVPVPVEVDLIRDTWANGKSINLEKVA